MLRKHLWLSATVTALVLGAVLWGALALAAPDAEPEPLFQGPAQATSAAGALQNTIDFPTSEPAGVPPQRMRREGSTTSGAGMCGYL